MARTETLTAYRCKFSYMQRNNPIIDECREDIKSGKDPEFTFSDFMAMYTENTNDVLIGKNSDRAIGLTNDRISTNKSNETRFVKGIFFIRERPAQNHDRALSK